ncbi:MAG: hypothetical protein HN341_01705 [Verrucomicrobia bacterium]|jgi:hypothetical protein|nr:hypothetical protein [Verrucomicrobiota bacterium]
MIRPEQQPQWNSEDPETSLVSLWKFLHAQAREMLLEAGTHLEIVFVVSGDGTVQPQPIAPPLPRDAVADVLREQIPGSSVCGLIHIGEGWAYIPTGKGDHTHKQLILGEMGVSDLNDDDRTEVLASSLLSQGGNRCALLDEIIRPAGGPASLGRTILNENARFPLGNVLWDVT